MNEPILHRLVSNCYDYLLTFTMMHSRWHKLLVSCRKLNVSSSKMEKRLALLYEFWQTRDNLNSYTRLDYTILPLLRHLTYLWLCPSFGFSSLLYLSLLFPISERTHLTQVSIKLLWLFTYLLSDAKSLKWAYHELQKVKMPQALKWKKKACSFFISILTNSRQP